MNLNRIRRTRQIATTVCLGLLLTGTPLLTLLESRAVQAQTQAVPAEVRQGYVLLGKGWVNDAITTFQRAIAQYPRSVEARLGLAIAYRRAGQDAQAWQAYQQVLELDPNNQLALKTIGTLGGYKPEWQARGIEALTALLAIVPNDLEARAQRALLYGYQNKFAEALSDYEQVLAANPVPEVLLNAAQIYTYAGNPQRGLELFTQYQSRGGTITGNAAIAYARSLRLSGNVAQAIRILEAQLTPQINAYTIQVRSELSQAYLANRQPTQALAVLDPLRERGDSRLALARALNEIGKQENRPELSAQAAALYKQVLTSLPSPNAAFIRETAEVLSAIPQERQYSLQLFRQLIQQQPENRILVIQQLALESQLGTMSRSEIRQRLTPILSAIPNEPAQQFAIAQALVRLDPDPDFLPIYQRFIQAGINEPFLHFRLAQVLIEKNDFEGARSAIATYQATSVGSRDRSPELLLAEIDQRQGNLELAAKRYETLMAITPLRKDLENGAIRGLAGVRLAQSRYTEALALYDRLIASNPDDLPLQLGRTAVAYQARAISERQAEQVLERFLQIRPSENPPELYFLVGVLPSDSKREALYTALIEADPSNVPVQVKLIQILARRDPSEARARANRLIARVRQLSPNDRSNVSLLFLKGQLEQTLGNLERANLAYQAILNLQPENLEAIAALGGVRFQQRKFESASQLYTQILELNPEHLGARRSLAELSAAQGNSLSALGQFEQLKIKQETQGNADPELNQRIQTLQEEMLKQRGFQPPWERY